MADEKNTGSPEEKPVEEQAREQTGKRQVRLRIDERNMRSGYANAFRANGTAEELMLDFGVNNIVPAAQQQAQEHPQQQPEIIFQVNERVILNYYTAKRLALTLGQLIRQHEDQFGTLELDVAKRRKNGL